MTAATPLPDLAGLGPSTVLGYPRIGPRRELKRALESYWDGRGSPADLATTGEQLRSTAWRRLAELGLAAIPSNTFSLYDQVLDQAVLVDAVPGRYRNPDDPLAAYFAMARGTGQVPPLRMTKWFDTNYHYLVPEIGVSARFRLAGGDSGAGSGAGAKPLAEVRQARAMGLATRPVLLGPVTFLLLSQPAPGSPAGFSPLDRLPDLLEVYASLLAALRAEGVAWVQLDEPALVADRSDTELAAVQAAYRQLGDLRERPRLFVATYFGELAEGLPALAGTPVEAVGLDLVRGPGVLDRPELALLRDKVVVAGVVSGRDVWRTDADVALARLHRLRQYVDRVVVGTSCSLLHVPYDLDQESDLDPQVRERLAFAEQKVAEVVALADRLADLPDPPDHPPAQPPAPAPAQPAVAANGRSPYPVRAAAQAAHLDLPPVPVTTIGSFPQTGELRAARAAVAAGSMPQAEYDRLVEAEIERAVRLQEQLGVDVLVHGEPERNDMVQYFAEHLDGFVTTRHGWVQSYGSRCTRPPILHGDVRRPAPITVRWARYAQSLTAKPVKGMLTGPVTIVAWSFVRPDLPLRQVMEQVAEAVREEVRDLEAAGIAVIQVDEPALRELLPLRAARQPEYLGWAVGAYRRATSGAADRTQIHTHLCYSDVDQIVAAIDALDADVTSVESARSGGRLLERPAVAEYRRGLGPGVYDIHSPRVPTVEEISELLAKALRVLPPERVWANPDCGLKTRTYPQVEAALSHLVTAARQAREAAVSPAP